MNSETGKLCFKLASLRWRKFLRLPNGRQSLNDEELFAGKKETKSRETFAQYRCLT